MKNPDPVYIESLTFTLGNVIAIIVATASIVTTVFAWINSAKNNKIRIGRIASDLSYLKDDLNMKISELHAETSEKFIHAKNSKKANINMIMEAIQKAEGDFQRRETLIYQRINETRLEQKEAHDKLSQKLDLLSGQMTVISTNLAELTGYLRTKDKS